MMNDSNYKDKTSSKCSSLLYPEIESISISPRQQRHSYECGHTISSKGKGRGHHNYNEQCSSSTEISATLRNTISGDGRRNDTSSIVDSIEHCRTLFTAPFAAPLENNSINRSINKTRKKQVCSTKDASGGATRNSAVFSPGKEAAGTIINERHYSLHKKNKLLSKADSGRRRRSNKSKTTITTHGSASTPPSQNNNFCNQEQTDNNNSINSDKKFFPSVGLSEQVFLQHQKEAKIRAAQMCEELTGYNPLHSTSGRTNGYSTYQHCHEISSNPSGDSNRKNMNRDDDDVEGTDMDNIRRTRSSNGHNDENAVFTHGLAIDRSNGIFGSRRSTIDLRHHQQHQRQEKRQQPLKIPAPKVRMPRIKDMPVPPLVEPPSSYLPSFIISDNNSRTRSTTGRKNRSDSHEKGRDLHTENLLRSDYVKGFPKHPQPLHEEKQTIRNLHRLVTGHYIMSEEEAKSNTAIAASSSATASTFTPTRRIGESLNNINNFGHVNEEQASSNSTSFDAKIFQDLVSEGDHISKCDGCDGLLVVSNVASLMICSKCRTISPAHAVIRTV